MRTTVLMTALAVVLATSALGGCATSATPERTASNEHCAASTTTGSLIVTTICGDRLTSHRQFVQALTESGARTADGKAAY